MNTERTAAYDKFEQVIKMSGAAVYADSMRKLWTVQEL